LSAVTKAQEKYGKSIKSLSAVVKDAQTLANDLTKASDRLHAQLSEQAEWEEQTKLRLALGKTLIKSSSDALDKTAKSAVQFANKLEEDTASVVSNQFSKGDSSKRDELLSSLKSALAKLETAERSGKEAEKLLKQAKSQGEKEASVYLTMYKYAVKPPATAGAAAVPSK